MKVEVRLDAPIYVVKGDDEVLLEDALVDLVHQLVGDGDRSLMVEELTAARYEDAHEEYRIGPLVDAAQTPPFLTDRRVVVGRNGAVFSRKDDVAPLVAYLADPLPTTALVLVWEKGPRQGAKVGAVPKSLADAVVACGGAVVDTGAGRGKERDAFVADQLAHAPLKLDPSARQLITESIGDDASKLVGILPTLVAVFGEGAKLTAEDVAPYLGAEGGVQPWDLTDAIDRGDVTGAVDKLHRLLEGGGRHPLQIMFSLTDHYIRMLALDGADVVDEKAAAAVLGIKGSTFPARKAMQQGRKLGSERLTEFVGLLAQADLDLRGARHWPPELVVEVLVARLASRTPKATARSAHARR